MSNCPSPERGFLCIFIGDPTLKIALVLFTLLSGGKRYMEDYWLFYITNQVGEWSKLILL